MYSFRDMNLWEVLHYKYVGVLLLSSESIYVDPSPLQSVSQQIHLAFEIDCGKRYIRRQNNPVITTIREKDRDRVIDGQTTNQVEIEFIWRTEWTITKPCIVRVDSKTWHAVPYSEWIKDNTLLVCSNLGLFKAFQSRSIIHG